MDLETLIIIVVAIGSLILSIALIVAVFTIKENSVRQTELLQEQSALLKSIRTSLNLELIKNVSKVQVKGINGEIKIVPLVDWLKNRTSEDNTIVENAV